MKVYRLQRIQRLPVSRKEAWDFFSDPANLARITPPSLDFRITSELPAKMYAGMIVTYTVTPFLGIKWMWVTEITHVDEERFFVDEQICGPYRLWHHEHHFRETAGGIEMKDIVSYVLPFGMAGNFARRFVQCRLEEIFDFRKRWLEENFR